MRHKKGAETRLFCLLLLLTEGLLLIEHAGKSGIQNDRHGN